MLLWLIIGLLTVGTLAALLLPLYRGKDTIETRDAYDANVFKDQLKAIDRELDEGQMDAEDAQSARIEISRNLLASADKADKTPSMTAHGRQLGQFTAMIIGLAVPLFAVSLYVNIGNPKLDDQPLHARANTAPSQQKISEIFAFAERKLVEKPNDGGLWEVMAGLYLKNAMYGKAENAYQNTIRLLGTSAERLSGLADAMILANDNIVGDKVLPVLKKAIKADPRHPKPRFWMALYHEQAGKFKRAEELYTALLKEASTQAPWRPAVTTRLNDVRKKQGLSSIQIAGVKPIAQPKIKLGNARKAQEQQVAGRPLSGPTADDIKAARQMSAGDRADMINNMVARLSSRLYAQGGDVNSWMRLVKVLNVQGKKAQAQKAVQAGKKNLRADKSAVARLDALANSLGLAAPARVGNTAGPASAIPPWKRQMGGPSAGDIKRAGKMSAADRAAMINNMVTRLSDRLQEQGGDVNSWMRLVNVLNVQGKKAEAQKAVQDGKKNLRNNRQAIAQLDALAKRLGLGS